MFTQMQAEMVQAKMVTENAFLPLRCFAEPWDYKHKFRFAVFDSEWRVFACSSILMRQALDQAELRSILHVAREYLQDQGYQLDPLQEGS